MKKEKKFRLKKNLKIKHLLNRPDASTEEREGQFLLPQPLAYSRVILGVQAAQWAVLFLFTIVDKILQTMLVVTTAAVQNFRT